MTRYLAPMSEHRFVPRVDPRPDDRAWPVATRPRAAGIVLTGEWVELRPATPADAAELRIALQDGRIWAHIAGGPPPDDEAAREWIVDVLSRGWLPWIIRLHREVSGIEAGSVVGWSSFLDIAEADARLEIGNTAYDPQVWGSVVNPECKLLLLTYAFETLGMGRVQLKTDVRNQRSQEAIARLGATFEGVLRRYQRRVDGTVRDTVMFSILADEWPEVRAGLRGRIASFNRVD